MAHRDIRRFATSPALAVLLACLSAGDPAVAPAGAVDDQRLRTEIGGANWLVNHGTPRAEHFSPLAGIDTGNTARLGLAWVFQSDQPDGLIATPIVIDGVIYLSGPRSVVYAIDAASGALKWRHDPEVDLGVSDGVSWSSRFNRGAAVWRGKVLVGTADCRLVALDAASGRQAWTQRTCDPAFGYSITGAPCVGGSLVFIGNAGSESDERNRGYLTAYDVDSGAQVWRFYTAPSGTADDAADPAMAMAAATWSGTALSTFGGGASVWDSMTYDPEHDLLLFGTAGALPYLHRYRSPQGGDNLFTNSVLALRASTGQYLWHYQTVPEDSWEYNANMNIVLADLEIGGKPRAVAMIAPKNGFFYVLDRLSGELLSAEKYARVNWAKGIDMKTGRPILAAEGRFWEHPGKIVNVWPNMWGAHSWNPMAWHPELRLAYIPKIEMPEAVTYYGDGDYHSEIAWPPQTAGQRHVPAQLVAWDPLSGSARWQVDHALPFNGGVLATGGGLVFQGDATGAFNAFDAANGAKLWSQSTGAAITGAPVSYLAGDQQYVAVTAGGGGGLRLVYPDLHATAASSGPGMLLAWKLDGTATLPKFESAVRPIPEPPAMRASPETIATGRKLYEYACMYCHGPRVRGNPGGSIPDLRYAGTETHAQWNEIVIGGSRRDAGMIPQEMSGQEAQAIRAYVIDRARQDRAAQND
jgi:quinohemoprotein ethanol dehydrogenase